MGKGGRCMKTDLQVGLTGEGGRGSRGALLYSRRRMGRVDMFVDG